MLCPACKDQSLTMADRQGVEIDYCPKCRGVWLDRGELDKIVERVAKDIAPSAAEAPAAPQERPPYRPDHAPRRDWDDDDYKYRGKYGYKKRKSILSEIFDF